MNLAREEVVAVGEDISVYSRSDDMEYVRKTTVLPGFVVGQ